MIVFSPSQSGKSSATWPCLDCLLILTNTNKRKINVEEQKKDMIAVGFEPTPPERLEPKSSALDHSATLPLAKFWQKYIIYIYAQSNPSYIRRFGWHRYVGDVILMTVMRCYQHHIGHFFEILLQYPVHR